MAEVDYVLAQGGQVIPVEVKSGKTGSLKSLVQFLKEKPQTPFGVHLSQNNSGVYQSIRQIPLYAFWRLFSEGGRRLL